VVLGRYLFQSLCTLSALKFEVPNIGIVLININVSNDTYVEVYV
jgi:hypothetical protein